MMKSKITAEEFAKSMSENIGYNVVTKEEIDVDYSIHASDFKSPAHRELIVKSVKLMKEYDYIYNHKIAGIDGVYVICDYAIYDGDQNYAFVECLNDPSSKKIQHKIQLADYADLLLIMFDSYNVSIDLKNNVNIKKFSREWS